MIGRRIDLSIPEMTYNFKRIERYNHAKPPKFLVRFWTLFVSF